MALKFTRKPSEYFSETAYVYDIAQSSQNFDKSVYEGLASSGNEDALQQYLYGIAGAKDKVMTAFNQADYDYLSVEDKANYTLNLLHNDPNSEEYKQAMEYFDYKVQEAVDKETYDSLNDFERTMNSIGGIIGNALNETILGTVEGLVDLGAVIFGQKDWAAQDFTGVGANREALQQYSRAYTYLDKNKAWSIANDVATGISQMSIMFIPYVGQVSYFGAMAGNTAADAVRANPDIDYLSLIGYTAAVTGVEFATEKISGKLLGGAGNVIDQKVFGKVAGKGLTKLGEMAAGSWVARIGLNFLSEGLEESIAEFADTALFNALIAQGNEELRKDYSMLDILYAGLIGGLIGGIMEGGRIATTSKLSITNDGDVVLTKDAKKLGVETKLDLNKTQSLTFTEQLAQAKAAIQTDAVADLQTKYADLSLKQIQELHPEEYQKAVAKNEKLSNRMTEIALGLNRVYELAGEEGFKKASELANGVFETQQRLLSNYVAKATGASSQNRAVENDFRFKNPNASVKILDSLTAEQIRLKRNFKNKFGIDLFYGEIGTKDGLNKKFGLTLDEKTIVIDEAQMGQLSEQEILNKIVKEELVHTLQFTEGIITPRTLFEINNAMGNTDIIPKELDPAYAKETGLTKLSEAQAKAVAEVLLFDKLTVSKMFYTQYSTMNKVYRFFKNIKTKIEESKQLRSEKGKLKYNTLLKAMKMYRDIAAEKIGNAENYDTVVKDFQLTQQEAEQLKEAYVEKTDVGPIENYETVMYAKERNPDKIPELYNENGEPKTFYKGADVSGITQFDNSLGNKKDIIPGASWFSDSRYIASTYVDKNNPESSIYSAKLNVKNPLVIDAQGRLFSEAFEGQTTNQLAQDAKEKGHDALIIKNVIDHGRYDFALETSTVVAVFDQTRVEITAEDKDILRKERDTKKAREILFGETAKTKKTDATDTAVHYGDFSKGIIKAEQSPSWNSKRSTGAFGTGTYLFSVEASDTGAASGYKDSMKKNKYVVKTSDYNLFKPKDSRQANALHEALADLNNYVLENDYYITQVEKEINRDIDAVVKDLSVILNISEQQIYDTLPVIIDKDYKTYENESGKITDTPATIFMKTLGYDGIDVRGIKDFDTSEYGTVIYDLKLEDVGIESQRTKENVSQEIKTAMSVAISEKQDVTVGEILAETTNEETLKTEPTIEEESQAYTGTIETDESNAQDVAQKIKDLVLTTEKKLSTMQLTKASEREYNVVSATMVAHNVFHSVTERNYTRVREIVSASPSALAVFDEAMTMITGANSNEKFSKEFVDKVQNLSRESGTASAQRQALQSAILKSLKPVTNMVKQLHDAGYDVNVDSELVNIYDPNLDIATKIKDLERQIEILQKELSEAEGNKLEQSALAQELFEATNALAAFKSGNTLDILDWLQNNVESFEGLNMSQKKLQRLLENFLETATRAEETGKEVGFYLKNANGELQSFPKAKKWLYNILKKVRNFRMWAMTSSPISWIRNWVGNFGMKQLDSATNVFERAISKTFVKGGKISADSLQFNSSKGGKELYKHIAKTHSDYISSLIRGETKYGSEEGKVTHARELRKKEYQDANGFRKFLIKAKEYNEWGLSTGIFGDDNFVYSTVCKNMGNLVASSQGYLLKGIKSELDTLTEIKTKRGLSDAQQLRYDVCQKAVTDSSLENIFDAIHPTEMKRLLESCHDRAKEQFFKNSNKFSRWMTNLANKSPITAELVSWVVPFPKVASNIMVMACRYSPLGVINAFNNLSKAKQAASDTSGKYDAALFQQQAIRNLSEASVGSLMMIAGVLFAALGWVDIDDDDYMGPSLRMGDIRISLSDLAPTMTTFSVAASFMYGWKNDKNAFELALNTIYDNTLLSNIDNVFRYSSPEQYAQNLSISYFASYIPAVVKLVNKWTTNSAYKDKTGSYWEKLGKTLASYVPGLSQNVANKVDPYTGETKYSTGTSSQFFNMIASISPLQLQWATKEGLEKEAISVDAETSGLSGDFEITPASKKGYDYDEKLKVTLKDFEKQKYAKYRAEYISNTFEDLKSGKETVKIKDDKTNKYKIVKYNDLTDEEKQRVLNNLYTNATKYTKIKYWLDQGNSYYVSDKDTYLKYKKLFGNTAKIVYRKSWKYSDFVED